jgi:hypothetical protein
MYERYNDMRVTGFQDFECIVQTQSTHVSELFAVMPAGMQLHLEIGGGYMLEFLPEEEPAAYQLPAGRRQLTIFSRVGNGSFLCWLSIKKSCGDHHRYTILYSVSAFVAAFYILGWLARPDACNDIGSVYRGPAGQ